MMNIFGAVAGIAGNWVDGKVEETKAKAAVKVEKAKADAEVQKRIATGDIDWEANMADATKDSWKDEFALVVLLLPAILVFIPSLTDHVKAGFEVLNTLPDWYQYLLFIAVSASFGVKGADKLMSMRGKKVAAPAGVVRGGVNTLSPNFTLQEMTKSQTAERLGLDNTPTEAHISSLKGVCQNVLEPLRTWANAPVIVSSGYRSEALCEEIGSSVTSQHAKGQAVDFEVIGHDNYKVAKWIEKNLDYDQLILEFYESGKPNSGWVHVSYKKDGQNRKQSLTFDGRSYQQGLNK